MKQCECAGCDKTIENDNKYCAECLNAGFLGDQIIITVEPEEICQLHLKKY